jgi:adenylyltransferase/sulfurtransferase
MAGKLLIYEALDTSFRTVTLRGDPACPLCGVNPRITAPFTS